MSAPMVRPLFRARPATPAPEEAPVSGMDRRVARPSRSRRRLLWAAGLLGVAGVAVAAYVRFGLTRTLLVNAEQIVVSQVESGLFTEFIPANAIVVPRTTAYLDAVEGGQVAEVRVEEGALVERGEVLVRLKNTNLQLEVLGRQAQLMEQLDRLNSTMLSFEQARLGHERDLIDASAQVEQLSQRLARRQALQASGAVSAAEVEEIRIDLERFRHLHGTMLEAREVDRRFQQQQMKQLREAIGATQENLEMAGQTLQSLAVKAPISGQLSALDADLGAAKAPGQRIGQIDDLTAFKVEARIDEFYVGRVAVGQAATVEIDGQVLPLEVAKVYPQVRERQFQVDLTFSGTPPRELRRGQSLQIRLEIGSARDSLLVANGPFYEDTGGAWVYVLGASGGEAQRRPVRLGRRNPEQVEVLSGLGAGERIITSSYEALRDYDRIGIRDTSK